MNILMDEILNKHMKIWCTYNIDVNLKKVIETPVTRQVPRGKPDYRDSRPTSSLTSRQMASHGKGRISARKQAQGGEKKCEMMENECWCNNKKYYKSQYNKYGLQFIFWQCWKTSTN